MSAVKVQSMQMPDKQMRYFLFFATKYNNFDVTENIFNLRKLSFDILFDKEPTIEHQY